MVARTCRLTPFHRNFPDAIFHVHLSIFLWHFWVFRPRHVSMYLNGIILWSRWFMEWLCLGGEFLFYCDFIYYCRSYLCFFFIIIMCNLYEMFISEYNFFKFFLERRSFFETFNTETIIFHMILWLMKFIRLTHNRNKKS